MEEEYQYKLFNILNDEDWLGLLDECFPKQTEEKEIYNIKQEVLYKLLIQLKDFESLKTVLVELEYVDKDYKNEFSNLYSKTFKKFSSKCKRLHLFQKKIDKIEIIKQGGLSTNTLMYLGYIVVRPVDVGKIGKTVISAKNSAFIADRDYVLCTETYKSHIFGKEFHVVGSPFIQQDTMVMTCAQASIWMAARYMHSKFGFPCHLPYEITESASTSLGWAGRALPSEGLTVYMMLNALNNMGYSPVFSLKPQEHEYDGDKIKFEKAKAKWNPIEYIYKYVESQIPVILIMPEHAITVIGHTFNADEKNEKVDEAMEKLIKDPEKKRAIVSSYLWVDSFIIHDDRSGPYKILPVEKGQIGKLKDKGFGRLFPQGDIYQTAEDIEGIIVPLPEKIYLLGNTIDLISQKIINDEEMVLQKIEAASARDCEIAKEFLACLNNKENPVVTRSYFIPSEQYKEKINTRSDGDKDGLHEDVKKKYLQMKMPKFIWVTEITTKKRLSNKNENERTIIGEILIDTTSNKHYNLPFIAMHFPGVFIEADYDNGKLKKAIPIIGDRPYCHISRQIKHGVGCN